jgi:general transcription factor 3C polypeptide 3 (transcription factor C subunit 4)
MPLALEMMPQVLRDVATQLLEADRVQLALRYFECYRTLNDRLGTGDAEAMIEQGKCYLRISDDSSAEECFIAAIGVDEDSLEARYELASLYERTQQKEQAFVLVNEVLNLKAARNGDGGGDNGDDAEFYMVTSSGKLLRRPRRRRRMARGATRVRWLGGMAVRREVEMQLAEQLQDKYAVCRELKDGIARGDEDAMEQWMDAAKELTDDFRAAKEFYPWRVYLGFLGYTDRKKPVATAAAAGQVDGGEEALEDGEELTAMAERLKQSE